MCRTCRDLHLFCRLQHFARGLLSFSKTVEEYSTYKERAPIQAKVSMTKSICQCACSWVSDSLWSFAIYCREQFF